MKSKRPPKNSHGTRKETRFLPVRWKVDYDYVESLSQEDKEWLSEFSDRYYGGDFREDKEWSSEERRKVYAGIHASKRDAYGLSREFGGLEFDEEDNRPSAEFDVSPTPRYLDDPRYKAALAKLRALWPTDLRYKPDSKSDEFQALVEEIRRIREGYEE